MTLYIYIVNNEVQSFIHCHTSLFFKFKSLFHSVWYYFFYLIMGYKIYKMSVLNFEGALEGDEEIKH